MYLIDKNVLQEIVKPNNDGHKNVMSWYATVDESELRFSVIIIKEWKKGIAKGAKKARGSASKKLEAQKQQESFDQFVNLRGDQIVNIGPREAEVWGEMAAEKDQNIYDLAIAATAYVNGYTVVTRNVKDFEGREVRILNPFKKPPELINF